jgi:hypothetical protein
MSKTITPGYNDWASSTASRPFRFTADLPLAAGTLYQGANAFEDDLMIICEENPCRHFLTPACEISAYILRITAKQKMEG